MKKILPFILGFFLLFITFLFPSLVFAGCNPPDDYSSCMAQNPAVNLQVRGYENIAGEKIFLYYHPLGSGLTDFGKAPQLSTLVADKTELPITNLYHTYHWVGDTRDALIKREDYPDTTIPVNFATVVGFGTKSGNTILVPDSGYDIGGGYEAMVLLATTTSITLKYTREDNIVWGYTVSIDGFSVHPEILNLYNQLDQKGRKELPVLCGGQKIGTATGGELKVTIRDTGSFMDPRWKNDWWQQDQPATINTSCQISSTAPTISPVKKGPVTIRGSGTGFFDGNVDFEEKETTAEEVTPPPTAEPTSEPSAFLPLSKRVGSVLASFFSSEDKENPDGKIEYHEVNFPNFTPITRIFSHALGALLPSNKIPSLAGATEAPIKTEVFPFSGNDLSQLKEEWGTDCENAAEHKQKLPAKEWGEPASATVGLNGPFTSQANLSNLSFFENFKYQGENVNPGCPSGFGPGPEAPKTSMPKPEPENEGKFSLKWITVVTNLIEEILEDNILTRLFEKKKRVKIAFKSIVPMADTAASYAKALGSSQLPEKLKDDFKSDNEAKALTVARGAKVGVTLSPEEEGYHPIIYGSLGEFRNYDCAAICTAYPEELTVSGLEWVGPGKICPSCDPEDYKTPRPPRSPCEDPDDTPGSSSCPLPSQYCNWVDTYSACQYGTYCNPNNSAGYSVAGCPDDLSGQDLIEPGCEDGQDPICESCLGLPHGYAVGEHMKWCGGEGGPRDCLADCSRCQWIYQTSWDEDTYTDERFNGCYYANANVCVQTNPADQSPGKICQYGCSPDCCKFCSN